MEKVDILIRSLEPEIDMKCADIRQKKSEKFLTGLFITIALIMLVVPAVLIFLGISLLTVFIPFIFVSAVFLAASPILMSKGADNCEQI